MNATRALLVFTVLCASVQADLFIGKDVALRNGIHSDGGRTRTSSHRLQLLFPLLLRISTRLATLVPTAIAALVGIFLFVAFAKKAFIVSLLALFLTYLDKYKRDEDVIRIHKINFYNDYEVLTHDEEYFHHGWPRKGYSHIGRYPIAYRYWPYPYKHQPNGKIQRRPSVSLEGFGRTSNYTIPNDFQQFLSDAIDSSGASLRYF